MSRSPNPTAGRWIDAVDVRLGFWLTAFGVAGGGAYVAASWDGPDRATMLVVFTIGLGGSLVMLRLSRWLTAQRRRAEVFFPLWSLGYIGLIAYLSSLDGGATSPLRAFLFVPVVFSALAYPVRQAVLVAVGAVSAFVIVSIVWSGMGDGSEFVVGTALAGVSWVGIVQARRAARARAELSDRHDAVSASEQRFRGGFEHSPVGMALFDDRCRYIEVNDALCQMLGCTPEWLRGRTWLDVTHPDDRERDQAISRGLREGALDHTQYEKRYVRPDGQIVHVLVSESVIRGEDGALRYFHSQIVDVTEQRQEAQRSRRRARQQAVIAAIGQRALDGAPFGELLEECVVAIQDTLRVPEAGVTELMPDGTIVVRAARGYEIGLVVNPDPATSQAGYTLATGGPVMMDDVETETRFEPVVARERGERSGLTVPIPGPDGAPYGVLLAHADKPHYFEADDLSFMQALANVLAGALSRDAAERRLRHLSLHDTLTGLPNRALLLDRLGHALDRSQRTDEVLAVMFLDVDHFKTVNDAFGHNAGDELLRALTPRLRQALRLGDTLARFGGDEFVVLCEGLDGSAGAMALAERLLDVFSTPFTLGRDGDHQTEHHLSASIGVAVAGAEHAGDPDALIRDADIAMYRAKQARGRVELFDQTSRTRVVERVRTTSELRRAIDEGELFMVYQPLVDLIDGSVRWVEALLRWEHPDRGLVSPDEFIPLAEESGLILPMGEWILDEVAAQVAAWDASGDPALAGLSCGVNLSARQLVERSLPDMVEGTLTRRGVDPARVVCEITETALIDDPLRAAENVEALAARGVAVALDDFCTGYSALEHIKRFPLSGIKLDRTFVADVATSKVDMAVLRGLVEMAGAMDLNTVAEGIETVEQLTHLREIGCDQAQGFLFAAPLTPAELAGFLRALPSGRFDLDGMHAATRAPAALA